MAGPNRYSTLVAWAKVVLPLMALALLSTLFLFSRTPDPEDALPFANVDPAQLATEQRLSRPRFAGTLEDGRAVTLSADSATQETGQPNMIALTKVEAEMTLPTGDVVTLDADRGAFDLGEQSLDLAGAVRAVTRAGYSLTSERISLAMAEMRLSAPGAIVMSAPGLTLEAGAMELTGAQGQGLFSFTGGVRLLYRPGE